MILHTSYLSVVSPDEQVYLGAIQYEYRISTIFSRKHHNPPFPGEPHWHDFKVTLHLAAVRPHTGLYGLNMIEAENALKAWADALPEVVNDCPLCPHGTTEELCHYFAKLPQESHVTLLEVAVAETPERVTILKLL